MMLGRRSRLAALTVHLTMSLGWLGALATYLVFDIQAATSESTDLLRTAYAAMHTITTWAILPLAVVSWASGILLAACTKWGLMRHWWVAISLALTTLALGVLVTESFVVADLAAAAAIGTDAEVLALPHTLPHSIGGLVILLIVDVLNVVKPRGLTRHGWRKNLGN